MPFKGIILILLIVVILAFIFKEDMYKFITKYFKK